MKDFEAFPFFIAACITIFACVLCFTISSCHYKEEKMHVDNGEVRVAKPTQYSSEWEQKK